MNISHEDKKQDQKKEFERVISNDSAYGSGTSFKKREGAYFSGARSSVPESEEDQIEDEGIEDCTDSKRDTVYHADASTQVCEQLYKLDLRDVRRFEQEKDEDSSQENKIILRARPRPKARPTELQVAVKKRKAVLARENNGYDADISSSDKGSGNSGESSPKSEDSGKRISTFSDVSTQSDDVNVTQNTDKATAGVDLRCKEDGDVDGASAIENRNYKLILDIETTTCSDNFHSASP